MTISVPADVISRLKAVLGEGGWSQDPDRIAPKLVEWRGRWTGTTPLLALPKTTAEVAAVVGICAESGTAITPQGGNTGLVSGQIPQGEILLSTERLRAVRDIDAFDDVIVAEAGVTLAAVHEAAAAINRRFPLGLASEGSATVGGVISTNAGGTQVLRYGTTRNLVLGVEAVLPNGEIWNGLKRLRKDNTGYDLKQLLIGAEGTLGVITAASLKLFPVLASRATAIVGLRTPHDAVALLARAKDATGGAIEAFELMGRPGLAFAVKNIPGVRDPLETEHPWYVLIETASGEPGAAEGAMERLLAGALEDDLIQDAAIAQTEVRRRASGRCARTSPAARRPRARPGSTTSPSRSRASPTSSTGRRRRCCSWTRPCASSPSATSATAMSTMTCCARTAATTRHTTNAATPARASCTISSPRWTARSAPSTAWARPRPPTPCATSPPSRWRPCAPSARRWTRGGS